MFLKSFSVGAAHDRDLNDLFWCILDLGWLNFTRTLSDELCLIREFYLEIFKEDLV
jgi:hypothetical protein